MKMERSSISIPSYEWTVRISKNICLPLPRSRPSVNLGKRKTTWLRSSHPHPFMDTTSTSPKFCLAILASPFSHDYFRSFWLSSNPYSPFTLPAIPSRWMLVLYLRANRAFGQKYPQILATKSTSPFAYFQMHPAILVLRELESFATFYHLSNIFFPTLDYKLHKVSCVAFLNHLYIPGF